MIALRCVRSRSECSRLASPWICMHTVGVVFNFTMRLLFLSQLNSTWSSWVCHTRLIFIVFLNTWTFNLDSEINLWELLSLISISSIQIDTWTDQTVFSGLSDTYSRRVWIARLWIYKYGHQCGNTFFAIIIFVMYYWHNLFFILFYWIKRSRNYYNAIKLTLSFLETLAYTTIWKSLTSYLTLNHTI